jgi:glycosyltransferase involved in cell wall biosynthesis
VRVLIEGHACAPDLGSEPAFTWNLALLLSAEHDVWVVTHPRHRPAVEAYLDTHPHPRLEFVWVNLPARLDPWAPEQGERGLRLHYVIWQHLALRAAQHIHHRAGLDVTHHVSWGTLSAPPLLWQLPVPFVWGPIGGGQTPPAAFRGYFGPAWRKEVLRSIRVRLLPLLPGLRNAARRSALVLATNRDTARLVRRSGGRRIALTHDSGILNERRPARVPRREPRTPLTLLWAGRFEARKGLPLALEALAQAPDVPARLVIAGDGPLEHEWRALSRRLGLADRVEFLGRRAWHEMPGLFNRADAFVFTSLRDSFGAVVLEAMAYALPLLTLDHQGVGDLVPPDCGIKVPVTQPAETVRGLAAGIRRLATDVEARHHMGEAAWRCAGELTWEQRARQFAGWYAECLSSARR